MSGTIPSPEEMEFDPTGYLGDGLDEENKPLYLPSLQAVNPFRDPDWRWHRACRLAEKGKEYSPETDDRETQLALEFARAFIACKTEGNRAALAKKEPDLYAAHQLYTQSGPAKWIIEARMLAGQRVHDVAKAIGVSKATIYWYQKIFFHVVGRLSASDYIRLKVIGRSAFKPIKPDEIATLLKLLAYYGGPVVLETVMPYLLSGAGDDTSDITNGAPELAEKIRRFIEILAIPDSVPALLQFLRGSGESPEGERGLEQPEADLEALAKVLGEYMDDATPPVGENEPADMEQVDKGTPNSELFNKMGKLPCSGSTRRTERIQLRTKIG